MRKALMPLLIILGLLGILIAVAMWYENSYGIEGPFRSQHGHGGHGHEDEPVLTPKRDK